MKISKFFDFNRIEFCTNRALLVILGVISAFVLRCNSQNGDVIEDCRQEEFCSGCVQTSPQCAWCTQPDYKGIYRCDVSTNLIAEGCAADYVFQSNSKVTVKEIRFKNRELGTIKEGSGIVTQLKPQRVQARIKPGETLTFPLHYRHIGESQDIYVLNSRAEDKGVTIAYSVDCKGKIEETNVCNQVTGDEQLTFNVSVTLSQDGCEVSQGGVVVSIGVGGVREIVAVLIIPNCGCDCTKIENQEPRSPYCSGRGTLVCGQCNCDPGWGGSLCECSLDRGVSAKDLENQCKSTPDEPVCSAKGTCKCGECLCKDSQVTGKYCDCDESECPKSSGVECGGHGTCECGECQCQAGWDGDACDCSLDEDPCTDDDGEVCSDHGKCACGKCDCDVGYHGEFCSEHRPAAPTKPTAVDDSTQTGASHRGNTTSTATSVSSDGKLPVLAVQILVLQLWCRR